MVKRDAAAVHAGPKTVSKRLRPPIQVVKCGAAFPISTKPRRPQQPPHPSESAKKKKEEDDKLLDWHDTVKQVRLLGSTGFTGQQRRGHQDEQYQQLTGRLKKKHQVPLPIVRGIRKKAAERQARQLQDARDAGIVLPTAPPKDDKAKKKDSTNRVHGPAPSIGFMKKGVFRVPMKK